LTGVATRVDCAAAIAIRKSVKSAPTTVDTVSRAASRASANSRSAQEGPVAASTVGRSAGGRDRTRSEVADSGSAQDEPVAASTVGEPTGGEDRTRSKAADCRSAQEGPGAASIVGRSTGGRDRTRSKAADSGSAQEGPGAASIVGRSTGGMARSGGAKGRGESDAGERLDEVGEAVAGVHAGDHTSVSATVADGRSARMQLGSASIVGRSARKTACPISTGECGTVFIPVGFKQASGNSTGPGCLEAAAVRASRAALR
jgi:hypothetical protein